MLVKYHYSEDKIIIDTFNRLSVIYYYLKKETIFRGKQNEKTIKLLEQILNIKY